MLATGQPTSAITEPKVNSPPFAVNSSPSAGVNLSRGSKNPTFSWTFSDVDGNSQYSYQVQLRKQSGSYGDADSKDSGEIVSSANSFTPTSFNLSGDTYYWKVRVKDNSGFDNALGAWINETIFSIVNTPPVLSWTGEQNYSDGGVCPRTVTGNGTYKYKIKYSDADNDTPLTGYPKIHIKSGSIEIAGSPFVMSAVDADANDYVSGKVYEYLPTVLSGGDYSYYFEAQDCNRAGATGTPITLNNGPTVITNPPVASEAKVLHSVFKPGQSEKCYVTYNAQQAGDFTVRVLILPGKRSKNCSGVL
jgi:hypothetical protein